MPFAIAFWVLMILLAVFTFGGWYPLAPTLITFALFGLLGWRTFGAPLQG